MKHGLGSPYYKVLYYPSKDGAVDYSKYVTRFSYAHCEEEDDTCNISFDFDKLSIIDDKAFVKRSRWKVTWGYINGPSHTEKIFVEEVTPDLNARGITMNIIAHDKYASVKKQKSQRVYKNATMPGVASKIAEQNGMKVRVQKPAENSSPHNPYQLAKLVGKEPWEVDNRVINPNDPNAVAKAQKNIEKMMDNYSRSRQADPTQWVETQSGQHVDMYDAYPHLEQIAIKSNPGVNDLIKNGQLNNKSQLRDYLYFKNHYAKFPTLPQANRSHAALLRAMARRQAGGPFQVSGHSENIYIKYRYIKKKPIYGYVYGSNKGLLLTFSPETRHKTYQAAASAVPFVGWNPLNKDPYFGNVTGINHNGDKGKLGGGAIPYSPRVNEGWNRLGGKTLPDGRTSALGYFGVRTDNGAGPYFNSGGGLTQIDATAAPFIATTLLKKEPEPTPDNNSPIGTALPTAGQAFSQGSNAQQKASWDINPGVMTVVGNAKLISGEVVTVKNVGKRYSGNYYITKATHTMDKSSGYITSLEIVRNTTGSKLPLNGELSTSEDIKSNINKQEGKEGDDTKTKQVPTKVEDNG